MHALKYSAFVAALALFITGCEGDLNSIHKKVATDAVDQYNIAKRQGDPIQICVQAGLVSAAYLQAKDEANYQRWKRTESEDCKRAGVPQ